MVGLISGACALVLGWYLPRLIAAWAARRGYHWAALIPVWLLLSATGIVLSFLGMALTIDAYGATYGMFLWIAASTILVSPIAMWRGRKSSFSAPL